MKKIIPLIILSLIVCLPACADTTSAKETLIATITAELKILVAELNQILANQAAQIAPVQVVASSPAPKVGDVPTMPEDGPVTFSIVPQDCSETEVSEDNEGNSASVYQSFGFLYEGSFSDGTFEYGTSSLDMSVPIYPYRTRLTLGHQFNNLAPGIYSYDARFEDALATVLDATGTVDVTDCASN